MKSEIPDKRNALQKRAAWCLEMAEQLEIHFLLGSKVPIWDVDKAAALIDSFLPSSRDEAILEAAELDKVAKEIARPMKPGAFEQLREALGLGPEIVLVEVLKAAIAHIKMCKRSRRE